MRIFSPGPANISERVTFEGIEFDVMTHVRFHSRVVLTDNGWRLNSFEGIYESDSVQPVNPADILPIDWNIVNAMRPSYRFLGFCQAYRSCLAPMFCAISD